MSKDNWKAVLMRHIETREMSCSINEDWIQKQYDRQKGRCYWFGIPMIPSTKSRDSFQPSLDRLDNSRGYHPDNVVLTSFAANFGRNQSTVDEWRHLLTIMEDNLHRAGWLFDE